MVKTKKRKRENKNTLSITGHNTISDEALAISAFDWDEATPTELWRAVLDDNVLSYYDFCKSKGIVPETLQIGTKHVWELSFQYGSWLTCMWIMLRVHMRFPIEERIKFSRVVIEMDECALVKFARIWMITCLPAFQATIICSLESLVKWESIMAKVGKKIIQTHTDLILV